MSDLFHTIFQGKKPDMSEQTYIFPRENQFLLPPNQMAIQAMLRPGTTFGSVSASTGALHLRLAEESLVEVEVFWLDQWENLVGKW